MPSAIIALRFVTGAALACVYPPGMKIAAGWFKERRGMALGVLVGAVCLGSAFPHLLAWNAAAVPWRTLMFASSLLALCGGVLVWLTVKDGPHVAASAPFDPHAIGAVIRNRGARLATFGYLGHMWELYAVWAWIPAFAAAWLTSSGLAPERTGSLVAFVAIASGAIGCGIAGVWADRWGKARIAGSALVISGLCSLFAGALFGGPVWLLFALAVVWGFSVVADSAQFSALVTEHTPAHPRRHRAHAADVRRVPADDGELAAVAAARGELWLAVGVRAAGARPGAGRDRDAKNAAGTLSVSAPHPLR